MGMWDEENYPTVDPYADPGSGEGYNYEPIDPWGRGTVDAGPQMIQPGPVSPLPYGNNPYPVKTGIYGTEPPPKAYGIQDQKGGPNTLGSRPFFVPSGQGGAGGQRIPGQAYGPSGPTGQFMTAPPMGPMPEFKLPIRDEARIGSLTQKAAGPGMREMRKGLREAQRRYYENPNVRRMTLRDAMAGYGMGIEKVMQGARREAQAEYEAEFAPQMTKATMEYRAGVEQQLSQY